MTIREILLSLTGTDAGRLSTGAALTTALMVAQRWSAHLKVLHVRSDSHDLTPMVGDGLSGAMLDEMMSAAEKESSDRADAVHSLFEQFISRHNVPMHDHNAGSGHASASFAVVTGREEDIVSQQARLADLTVLTNPESDDNLTSSDALHAVLFDSGRPVLISPRTSPASIGTRVCVAWNGTAESAASVLSAIPWMQRADGVRILSAEGYQRRGPAAPFLATYLASHGVNADIVMFPSIRNSVGAGLLEAARLYGCDLLSMGAYSHSRLRQLILGGVTRHVLENSDLPVMMTR